jgi:hypothetical protein
MSNKEWQEEQEDLSADENIDKRLLLDNAEREVLRQCRMTIWDGNVSSKSARDSLRGKGLITSWKGWQVVTREGMAVLDALGEMKDVRWPRSRYIQATRRRG